MTFKDKKQFGEFLKNATVSELKANRFGCWDKQGSKSLYLIPSQYYKLIPTGQKVYGLGFQEEKFTPKTHDDEPRFGLLAYGIIRVSTKTATTKKPISKTKTKKK